MSFGTIPSFPQARIVDCSNFVSFVEETCKKDPSSPKTFAASAEFLCQRQFPAFERQERKIQNYFAELYRGPTINSSIMVFFFFVFVFLKHALLGESLRTLTTFLRRIVVLFSLIYQDASECSCTIYVDLVPFLQSEECRYLLCVLYFITHVP